MDYIVWYSYAYAYSWTRELIQITVFEVVTDSTDISKDFDGELFIVDVDEDSDSAGILYLCFAQYERGDGEDLNVVNLGT